MQSIAFIGKVQHFCNVNVLKVAFRKKKEKSQLCLTEMPIPNISYFSSKACSEDAVLWLLSITAQDETEPSHQPAGQRPGAHSRAQQEQRGARAVLTCALWALCGAGGAAQG